jgi:RNA polymerase sigma factor (sigma-70 family)
MANAGANSGEAATGDEPADDVLLERFTAQREQAAFAALVRRHGPMVLGVCRRVLQHEQDAEDAFQAVFCVLARKAGTIRRRTAMGGWLYAVAFRIARKAKTLQVRHRMRARPLPDIPVPANPPEWEWRDLWPILDEEVNRLPERYRQPFLLCHLEGKTTREAAAELRCPPGTVSSRLTRARERLRGRLARRGLALSAGALAAAVSRQTATAAVPAELAQTAVRKGLGYSAGLRLADRAADLANGFLKTQALTRWVIAAGLLLAAGSVSVPPVLLLTHARKAQTDAELLQGTWKAARLWVGGQQVPPLNLEMIFAGDGFTMRADILPQPMSATFRVDPSKDPKEIDLVYPNGVTNPGIYRLDGDRLQLSINTEGAERPANFSPDKRFWQYELQRTTVGQR